MSDHDVRAETEPLPAGGERAPAEADTSTRRREGARRDLVHLARGAGLNLIGGVANGVLQFVLIVIVTRALGASGTGLFFEAVAVFTILSAAAILGADAGVVRWMPPLVVAGRRSEAGGVLSHALWPPLAGSVVAAACAFVAAPWLASVFMGDVAPSEGARYLRLLLPFVPMATATAILLAGTRGLGTMVPTVTIENVGKPLLRVTLALVAVAAGAGVVGVAAVWVLPVAIGLVAAAIAFRNLAGRPDRVETSDLVHELSTGAPAFWRFAAPRGLAGVLEISLGWVDLLLLGAFVSAAEVGVYAAVSRTAVMFLFALRATGYAVAPKISALLSTGRRGDAEHLYQAATRWLILVSWPIYLTLAVFGQVLLGVFGDEFTDGARALAILSVAMLVNMATGNVNAMLLMGGKSSWNLLNAALALGVNLTLNLVLIPRLGIEGAAIAWAVSIVVQNTLATIQAKVLLKVDPFGPGYLTAAGLAGLCFGAVGLILVGLAGMGMTSLVLALTIGTACYLLALHAAREVLQLGAVKDAMMSGLGRKA